MGIIKKASQHSVSLPATGPCDTARTGFSAILDSGIKTALFGGQRHNNNARRVFALPHGAGNDFGGVGIKMIGLKANPFLVLPVMLALLAASSLAGSGAAMAQSSSPSPATQPVASASPVPSATPTLDNAAAVTVASPTPDILTAAQPAPATAPGTATQQTTTTTTTTTTADPSLPASTDTPPADIQDPLAEFRRAQQAEAPAAPTDGSAPTPTPGGFQQPADGQPSDQYYNLQTLTAEDIEARQAELEQKAREQAFDAALNGMMPMSPEQIRAMLDKYKVTREASESRIGGTPKPEVTVETVSLEPGATPPVIKLSGGHVTSINMMDITGQPWAVQDVSWGGNFEVISPEEGGHVIRVSPMAAHEVGNMSVQLVGLKTPVTFTLETQIDVVQYRFDARIPEYGPLASPPIIDPGLTIAAGSDKVLAQILDGVPPSGTEKLTVSGVDARTAVFRQGGSTYLRTPLTLLSPGWSASVKSGDGMTVYAVNNSPVLLLSDHGKLVRAQVEENRNVQ